MYIHARRIFSQNLKFLRLPFRIIGSAVIKDLQITQLSLTNRATHLCKCNDLADLTSVIKIRLKNFDSSHPAYQDHSRSLEIWNRHESTRHL